MTGVTVYRGASLEPPGDEVGILVTVDGSRGVFALLAEEGFLREGSAYSSELRSLLSPGDAEAFEWEGRETAWEETGFLLRRETNPRAGFFLLMALSGAIAAAGLWADALQVVVGAMVIAPGFEPITRIAFGLVPGPARHVRQGALGVAGGYASLAAGAALTYAALALAPPGSPADLEGRFWVQYWSSITVEGVWIGLLAGAAGGLAILTDRPVLTAGAMIALALIPGMAILGMGLAAGDLSLAARGLGRWGVDAALVLVSNAVTIALTDAVVHRRRAAA